MGFLIANKEDYINNGSPTFDYIVVTADAYVDHPSFGSTIIARILEKEGYKVGIIAQPNWKTTDDFTMYGEPKYGFLISGGNIDSMVNHYSVNKNKRKTEIYSPNGKIGLRPDRPTIVYSNKIREVYKTTPIIVGGVEASLRRLSHYDYWDNQVRRSIIMDGNFDLLVYGMGEKQIVEIADCLKSGIPIDQITFVRGTVYKTKNIDNVYDYDLLPPYTTVKKDKKAYNESFKIQYKNLEYGSAKTLIEPYGNVFVVQNRPMTPLTTEEFDAVYALPYERTYHPMYEKDGGIPAIKEVKFSLVSNRGCFGRCNFCAITFHQGGSVQVRSHKSIVTEASNFQWEEDFKGYIHDVGGPTANFRHPACSKQTPDGVGACMNKRCLEPKPCNRLKVDHSDYLKLLRELRELPKVKKVFIRSGIRYDYLMADKDDTFFNELCEHHISGQLKVAPEHISNKVLEKMGKPDNDVYLKFVDKYYKINKRLNKEQYLVPYLMSSHPGSNLDDAIKLAEYLRDIRHMPEQVQDFYPTPATLSTCIFYTGVDPLTNEEVFVPRTREEKAMQRALIQYRLPQNYDLVKKALLKSDRPDLIGFDEKCLIRPRNNTSWSKNNSSSKNSSSKNSSSKNSSSKNSSSKNSSNKNGYNKNKNEGRNENKPKGKNSASKNGTNKDYTSGAKSTRKPKKTIRNTHKKK